MIYFLFGMIIAILGIYGLIITLLYNTTLNLIAKSPEFKEYREKQKRKNFFNRL